MYKRYSLWLLSAAALITVLMLFAAARIEFEYDFEKFFPAEDEELSFYYQFREQFEPDNNFLLIGLDNEGASVFDTAFLQRTHRLTRQLSRGPAVDTVLSLTHSGLVAITSLGKPFVRPWLHVSQPNQLAADSARIFRNRQLTSSLIAADAKALSVAVLFKPPLPHPVADSLLAHVNQALAKTGFADAPIAGKIRAERVYLSRMQTELMGFMSASALLVAIFLWFTYRSWWAVVFPIGITLLAIIWTVGTMQLTGKNLDALMVILPSILFIVGMSDVVHLLTRFLDEMQKGKNKIAALKLAVKETGLATLLTSVTTAIGFLTLISANVILIKEFGIYAAVGVILALVATYLTLPALLLMLPRRMLLLRQRLSANWNPMLGRLFIWIVRHGKMIMVGFVVLTVAALGAASTIKLNTTLLEDLGPNDPLKLDFDFFEKQFGGTRPFEMAFFTKDGSPLTTPENIQAAYQLEQAAEQAFKMETPASVVFLVKGLNQAQNLGDEAFFALPKSDREVRRTKKALTKLQADGQLKPFLNATADTGRMAGRMPDIGSLLFKERADSLQKLWNASPASQRVDYRLTGTSLLIDRNNEHLTANLVRGIFISVTIVSLLVGFLYKSIKVVPVMVVVNLLPLIFIAGLMGVSGIFLKISTSIIFTIAFGIAVDDTIHFIGKLRLELDKGRSLIYALKRTFLSTGKAIIVTSFIIVAGFVLLMFSSFSGTFYTGLLISLTLTFAVVADLLLLPPLLLWIKVGKKK